MPAVEDSVSWHDVIPRKRSLCQKNAILLMVHWLGVIAAMPTVFGSTLTLPTFIFFFAFFQVPIRCYSTFSGLCCLLG